jgi:cytochrome c oxidase assembly protein subunit 15
MAEVKRSSPGRSDILALGFCTASAMWSAGYFLRLSESTPPVLVFLLMLGILLAGGWYSGRYSGRGPAGGLMTGLLAGLVNLLILGSLRDVISAEGAPSIAIWAPGSIIAQGVITMLGALLGSRGYDSQRPATNWTGVFAICAALTTLVLLFAGGLVTSTRTGMSVPDWPSTYGSNMFLFPLQKMTGGIFFEHSHRLLGSLVGLITLCLSIHLALVEKRAFVKAMGFAALAMVIIQGVLGGVRVTDNLLVLAFAHGVFGQAVFAMLVAIAALVSTRWLSGEAPLQVSSALTEQRMTRVLLGLLLLQISLGSLLRHMGSFTMLHIALAIIIVIFAAFIGIRISACYPQLKPVSLLGSGLMHIAFTQLLLGFAALAGRGMASKAGQLYSATHTEVAANPPLFYIISTSAHQIMGALLLAWAVLLACWVSRQLVHGVQSAEAARESGSPAG